MKFCIIFILEFVCNTFALAGKKFKNGRSSNGCLTLKSLCRTVLLEPIWSYMRKEGQSKYTKKKEKKMKIFHI